CLSHWIAISQRASQSSKPSGAGENRRCAMAKAAVKRHTVTLSAVVQRLNRHIAKRDHIVRSPRGRGPRKDGTYFIVDFNRGRIVAEGLTTAQVEKLARELGCLEAWEEVR